MSSVKTPETQAPNTDDLFNEDFEEVIETAAEYHRLAHFVIHNFRHNPCQERFEGRK